MSFLTTNTLCPILDFIRAFLKSVGELKEDEYTGPICREAYEKTLAKHHSFIVKNGAKLAMYTMPTRDQLLKRVSVLVKYSFYHLIVISLTHTGLCRR